jgi:hypothetical protein
MAEKEDTVSVDAPLRPVNSILRYLCRDWTEVTLPAYTQEDREKVIGDEHAYTPWLKENGIKKYWLVTNIDDIYHGYRGKIVWRFKYEEDALLFKLTWC